MDQVCAVCSKSSDQLFETRNGVYTCLKCNPMMPEVELELTVDSKGEEGDEQGDGEIMFCDICSKSFTKSLQYHNHMRNHRADKRFVCTYCNKAFSQSNNLRAHLRIHTNERPFKCNECGKAFTQVTNLNNHVRLHTGERPFVCAVEGCGKAFAQVTNLNQHRKRHLSGRDMEGDGEKVYCTVCGMQFDHRIRMYLHRKEAHGSQSSTSGDTQYPCMSCEQVFSDEEDLKTHQLEHKVQDTGKRQDEETKGEYWCVFKACAQQCNNIEEYRQHLSTKHNLHIKGTSVKMETTAARPRGRPPKDKNRESDFQAVFLPNAKAHILF